MDGPRFLAIDVLKNNDLEPGMGMKTERGILNLKVAGGIIVIFTFALTLSASSNCFAQKPPRKAKMRAVERGLFSEVNVGFTQMVTNPKEGNFSSGVGVSTYFGYDVSPFFSLLVGADVISSSGQGETLVEQSDGLWLIPTVQMQLALVTTLRHFVWARAGAGWSFVEPSEVEGVKVAGEPGLTVGASMSYEYHTRLRRFAIGARLGAIALGGADWAVAIQALPYLRYTF